jgi:hypothetical protein
VSAKSAETPENLRQRAAHARWLANELPWDEGAPRLLDYARELEARAAALERTLPEGSAGGE